MSEQTLPNEVIRGQFYRAAHVLSHHLSSTPGRLVPLPNEQGGADLWSANAGQEPERWITLVKREMGAKWEAPEPGASFQDEREW